MKISKAAQQGSAQYVELRCAWKALCCVDHEFGAAQLRGPFIK